MPFIDRLSDLCVAVNPQKILLQVVILYGLSNR
jgi:hypothetical protein